MSNQILVPRNDNEGGLGTPTKRWGNASFTSASIDNLTATLVGVTQSGSFEGDFTGDGSGLTEVKSIGDRDNFVIVKQKSDFPAPTGSVITLEDNTVYELNGLIDIGTDRIVYGTGSNVIGRTRPDGILYHGTDTAVTSINNEVRMYVTNISAPSGSAVNLQGTDSQYCVMQLAGLVDAKNIGHITGFAGIVFNTCRFSGVSDRYSEGGLIFGGSNIEHISMAGCTFQYFTSGSSIIKFEDNLSMLGGKLVSSVFVDSPGSTPILVGGNVSVEEQFTVAANNFFHEEVYQFQVSPIRGTVPSDEIGVGHPDWLFRDNSGVRDSLANVNYFIPDGATIIETTIPAVDTIVKLEANTIRQPDGQLFEHNNSQRATYTGKRDKVVDISGHFSISSAANNQVFSVTAHKNGQHIAGSTSQIRCETAGQPYPGTTVASTIIRPGDYIELWVENLTSAANVSAQTLSVIIR